MSSPALASPVPALRERAGRRTLRRQGSISEVEGEGRAMSLEPERRKAEEATVTGLVITTQLKHMTDVALRVKISFKFEFVAATVA